MPQWPNAIDLFWRNLAYYGLRAEAKEALQDYTGAKADYTKIIELDPKSGLAYKSRGLVKLKLKDKNGACLDFSKAGELGLDDAYDAIREYCN